jgi:predicted type IV restriction endonuclease
MPVPAEISQLVELFERNIDQYRAPAFTEAAVRHQFIDPLFIALGWDVNSAQGAATQPHDPEGRPRSSGGSR